MARKRKGNTSFKHDSGEKFNKEQRGIDHDLNNAEHAIKKDDTKFRRASKGKKSARMPEDVPRTRFGNDPIWYGLNDQLLKDAGSLSFNNPIGIPVDDVISSSAPGGPLVIPGIATIDYLPGIGISESNASPVNVAARRLYTFIRHIL